MTMTHFGLLNCRSVVGSCNLESFIYRAALLTDGFCTAPTVLGKKAFGTRWFIGGPTRPGEPVCARCFQGNTEADR